jgi:lipoprotein-anchoring transpeptidase ErfK/SrfK
VKTNMPNARRPIVMVALVLLVLMGTTFAARAAPETVTFSSKGSPGTIVVRTNERRLYLVQGGGKALRYVVAVGRADKQWFGTTSITSKHIKPAWTAPADMRRSPIAVVIPSGAPNNPMGDAALVLAHHELAIHGTNRPDLVGGFVSNGCIRMRNADIMDLFGRVGVGTTVLISR